MKFETRPERRDRERDRQKAYKESPEGDAADANSNRHCYPPQTWKLNGAACNVRSFAQFSIEELRCAMLLHHNDSGMQLV